MPWAVPFVFTAGTPIVASELEATSTTLQDYLNQSIVKADIDADSIVTQDIVTGEPYGVTQDHQFTRGETYQHFIEGQDRLRDWFTGQLKYIKDLGSTTRWEPIAGTGKSFHLEADANVLYHAWIETYHGPNLLNKTTAGTDHGICIAIDGVTRPSTFAYMFTEDDTSVSVNSGALSNSITNRRNYPIEYWIPLTAGTHTICVVTNSNGDKGYLGARNVSLETLYF